MHEHTIPRVSARDPDALSASTPAPARARPHTQGGGFPTPHRHPSLLFGAFQRKCNAPNVCCFHLLATPQGQFELSLFYRCECPLILPVSPSVELPSAIADLVVCMNMKHFSVDLPDHVRDEVTAIDLGADKVYTHLLVLH
jgi:hypothetical protein